MKYSAVGVGLSFAAGIAIGGILPKYIPVSPIYAAAVGTVLLSLVLSRWHRNLLAGLLISVALFGVIRGLVTQIPVESLYGRAAALRDVTGTVVSYPRIGDGFVRFTIAPDSTFGRVLITWYVPGRLYGAVVYGERVHVVGQGEIPPKFSDFDYRAYLAQRGVFAVMRVDKNGAVERVGYAGNVLLRIGDILRQKLLGKLDRVLPKEEAGLAHGIIFGDRTVLSDSLAAAFRRTGLMHILAVSGLHLGIFLAGIWFVLRIIGLRAVLVYPIVGMAVLVILLVIGPRVSLTRAALMFAFIGLGSVLVEVGLIMRRWIYPFQSLAAAGVVLLALQPGSIQDIGFQLSFGATAMILFIFSSEFRLTERVERLTTNFAFGSSLLRYGLLLVLTSGAAQAGTAPFLAYHFGAFYPLTLFANLLVVPLAAVGLWSGLLAVILSPTFLFAYAGSILAIVLHTIIVVVMWMGKFPCVYLRVPSWMGVWLGGIVVYLIMLAYYQRCSSCTSYSTSITSSTGGGVLRERENR